jgi:hypothetical protein
VIVFAQFGAHAGKLAEADGCQKEFSRRTSGIQASAKNVQQLAVDVLPRFHRFEKSFTEF